MTEPSFADLLGRDDVVEHCELRSTFGFMAYHGGVEAMTDTIAAEAARRSGASYYAVVQPDDLDWHVPSRNVSPAHSPVLQSFVDHVEVVVTVHGYGRHGMFTSLLLGGRNRRLAAVVAERLRHHLPGYEHVDDLAGIPKELRGQMASNPVNLPRRAGVQVELPPRVRGGGPYWADWQGGLTPHTESLITALAEVAATHP